MISEAVWPDERDLVAALMREYVDALAEDISFQDVAGELAGLPGAYARPRGVVLLARCDGEAAGLAAMRPINADTCEMKRLYVRPNFRGRDLGRLLAEALIAEARACGYRTMLLDTLASMQAARALYRSLGFRPTAPYYANPLPGVTYMALDL